MLQQKGYHEVCQQILPHMDIVAATMEKRKGGSAAEVAQNTGHIEAANLINAHIAMQM